MDRSLIFLALIPAPLALFMVWCLVCELRGVPAFVDGEPTPGRLDGTARWMLGFVWLFLGAAAYLVGGFVAVLTLAAAIAVVAAVIALLWTIFQGVRPASPGQSGAPFHRRLVPNFRRLIVEVPVSWFSHG